MITPELISQWLAQPQPITDQAALDAVLSKYPYFLPARYMQAGDGYKKGIGSAGHLYKVHHLLFHEKMQQVHVVEKPAQHTDYIKSPAAPDPGTLVLVKEERQADEIETDTTPLIQPFFAEDYFRHQGLQVDDSLPPVQEIKAPLPQDEDPKALMVMMSFTDWLRHFKKKTEHEAEEAESRRAVRTMWQKEKLAAALEEEEEDDEIPEDVFKMAVDSIAKEDGLISESLAEILVKQQKWAKAIDMYRKLALKNPAKSVYFAAQIESLQKQNTEH